MEFSIAMCILLSNQPGSGQRGATSTMNEIAEKSKSYLLNRELTVSSSLGHMIPKESPGSYSTPKLCKNRFKNHDNA